MVKIDKIDKSRLKNDEHFQFHTETRDLIVKEGAANLNVEAQFNTYLPLYAKEDEGIKKVNKSFFTSKIQEADKARDDVYLSMVEINEASVKHYNPAIREAAKKLKILFDTYGNVAVKPLNEQTSAVYNILQELKGNYLEDVQAVGIEGWVNELEARNNAFDAFVKERIDEAAVKSDVVLRQARIELDAAYDVIVEYVNAYAVINNNDLYKRFIKALNFVINKYNAIVNARLGRRSKKETESTQTENTQTEGGSNEN